MHGLKLAAVAMVLGTVLAGCETDRHRHHRHHGHHGHYGPRHVEPARGWHPHDGRPRWAERSAPVERR